MNALDIHPRILLALRKATLSDFGAILAMSGPDLERVTQLSHNDICTLQTAVSKAVEKSPMVTGLQIYQKCCPREFQIYRLSTGCSVLNEFLRGGILSQGITEITGESASGKTQICMQLCLTVQLPMKSGGFGSGAVYICTEDVFPNRRLMQMANYFAQHNHLKDYKKLTDNIFIEHASDLDDLSFSLKHKVPVLLCQGKVRLIIIDSIAALFRCEFSIYDTIQRGRLLSSFAAHLKQLSTQYGASVICVNQVSANMRSSMNGHPMASSKNVIPALGISWANLVTTRLMVSRTNKFITIKEDDNSLEINIRSLEVLFSPDLPNSVCYYVIDKKGVRALQP